MAEKGGVQSVERIFQLIEHLAAHPTGVSLQTLAGETGLAKSTVHRLLASLVGLGYVVQDEENGHYRLTLKMFELSSGIVDSMDIMGVAKAHLERLSQRTGEAVHLVIRDGRDIVYIYKTESGPMRMSSRVVCAVRCTARASARRFWRRCPATSSRTSGRTAMCRS